MLFFSLFLIGEAAAPLKDYEGVQAWLRKLENSVRGAGALITLLIQSSWATLGMVIKLAADTSRMPVRIRLHSTRPSQRLRRLQANEGTEK